MHQRGYRLTPRAEGVFKEETRVDADDVHLVDRPRRLFALLLRVPFWMFEIDLTMVDAKFAQDVIFDPSGFCRGQQGVLVPVSFRAAGLNVDEDMNVSQEGCYLLDVGRCACERGGDDLGAVVGERPPDR